MLSDPVAKLTFFWELETQIRNSSIVGLAATEATPDDLWRQQRPRSHAWRNRCDDFLVGSSEDEGQCGWRNWKKASENRTLSLSTDTHVSSLAQASGRNTVVLDIGAYTLLRLNGYKVWQKEGPQGGLALHEYTWNDFRREHLELQDPGDSETTTLHREEARADYARTVKQLRRAPARRSCPPWSIPSRLWLLLMWPTFLRKEKRRFGAMGHKPPAGSQLLETRHDITSCLEATRRCDAAPVVSSRSLGWVIPKPGEVGFESCRLEHGMCDFWSVDSNEHVGGREQWLHTWHWQHAFDTRASHLLTRVWTWQTPSVRWTEKTQKT